VGSAQRPKFQLIADELREGIRAGRYGQGGQLPSENDLATRYGVARATARRALEAVQAEGLATGRAGAGVYVRTFQPVRRRAARRLAAEQWGTGQPIWQADTDDREYVVDQVDVREEPATDATIAAALAVPIGARLWTRRRRYLVEDRPVQLAASHLPADLVDGSPITGPNPGPGGIYARLRDLGAAPVRFREEIRVRMPTYDEAAALQLGPGAPVVLIARTAITAEGRPVEATFMTLNGTAYVLEYDIDA
jgi:GntR family transcriptional regulator